MLQIVQVVQFVRVDLVDQVVLSWILCLNFLDVNLHLNRDLPIMQSYYFHRSEDDRSNFRLLNAFMKFQNSHLNSKRATFRYLFAWIFLEFLRWPTVALYEYLSAFSELHFQEFLVSLLLVLFSRLFCLLFQSLHFSAGVNSPICSLMFILVLFYSLQP